MSLQSLIDDTQNNLLAIRQEIRELREKGRTVREKLDSLLQTKSLADKLSPEDFKALGLQIDEEGKIIQTA